MNLWTKFRETAMSVAPVAAITVILGIFVVPENSAAAGWMWRFLVSSVLLVFGLTLFLAGVDSGVEPMGERLGAALTARRSLSLMLGAAFVIGMVVTAAEPDIQVFGDQVHGVFPSVRKLPLVLSIAIGVGAFLSLGLFRIAARFSVKATLLVSYAALGALACFAPEQFVGVAFDSGGATTGPMTVPFVMALGLGVAASRATDRDGGFGLTGVASVGPVMAVLAYVLVLGPGAAVETAAGGAATHTAASPDLAAAFGHALREAAVSIAPLFAMLCIAQPLLLHATARQFVRIVSGFAWAFIGLSIFLAGVNGGFMQAGAILGSALGGRAAAGGAADLALLLGTGAAFGAIVVCAEPAVWILGDQVENVSGGAVPRRSLLLFLSTGTAAAIAIAMARAAYGFPLAAVLIPGYALAMLLMARSPSLFTAIAFDSGGVASGPLTSTFVLSFALGASGAGRGGTGAFGVIALVALFPLLAIQAMGIAVERKRKRATKQTR